MNKVANILIPFFLQSTTLSYFTFHNYRISFDTSNISIPIFLNDFITIPTDLSLPKTADGRHYPIIPTNSDQLIDLLIHVEEFLSNPNSPDSLYPIYSHQQQVIYRHLSENSYLSSLVLRRLPSALREKSSIHIKARLKFIGMAKKSKRPTTMPAWTIIPPIPLNDLLQYYLIAEKNTGIQWEILAAINLVETGMGRISGRSVANAQGPMQFLPTTWHEKGVGNGGDINDPYDSIQAAARYLVKRGALKDIRKGLWGYNNSNNYVDAVLLYSSLLSNDPLALKALYNWEIHYRVDVADLWLPIGYSQIQAIPISTYLKEVPASAPSAYPFIK